MRRHKHLFESVCSFENVMAAAKSALKGKRLRQPGADFLANLEPNVIDLCDELTAETYQPGAYRYFEIHEPKQRLVAAAPFRDRVVHHAIVRVIEPLFERRFIDDSFACRVGKGTHAAMRRALHFTKRYPFALKCDVQKYFPSISHDVLKATVARVLGDARLLALIDRVIDSHHDSVRQEWGTSGSLFDVENHQYGMPIGNLTSQFFANVYLDALDQFVKHTLRVKGYVRYLDDFILFEHSRAKLKSLGRRVIEQLESLELRMHPDKYRLLHSSQGVDFVGFVVRADGRIRVRTSTVKRFQACLANDRWQIRQRSRSAAQLTNSVRAWIAHVQHAQSYRLRYAVLSR